MMPSVRVIGAASLMMVAVASSLASERLEDGRRVYETICSKCHESGANGAPRIGQPKDWANRSRFWEANLFEHANKGYFGMPAKGGVDQLTEYEVDAAAEYMLTVTYPELPLD